MLLGELGPKNLALAVPERTASVLAIPVRIFGIVLGPVIRLFDASAAVITERVFRTAVAEERLTGYDADELTQIIAASREADQLTDHQGELLTRAVVLGDRRVHEVMVPRTRVEFLDADDTLDDLRAASRRSGHSRFPVRGQDDDVVGTVHIKDVLSVAPTDRDTTRLGAIAAPAVLVPESEPLRRLLARLRRRQRTFAMVIDEYGGVAGIVTVEDVVEELVGEIEDEFDDVSGPVRRVGPSRWLFDGTVRVDQVTDVLDWQVPTGDYETIAGFVIDRLGRIPSTGSSVRLDGWEFVAQRVDGVRLEQVLVRREEVDS
jgi:CBS domain containing-hemolysin-like protein